MAQYTRSILSLTSFMVKIDAYFWHSMVKIDGCLCQGPAQADNAIICHSIEYKSMLNIDLWYYCMVP